MSKAQELLAALGIQHATARHLGIVDKHLDMDDLIAEDLLTELGVWDKDDLAKLKNYLSNDSK